MAFMNYFPLSCARLNENLTDPETNEIKNCSVLFFCSVMNMHQSTERTEGG